MITVEKMSNNKTPFPFKYTSNCKWQYIIKADRFAISGMYT